MNIFIPLYLGYDNSYTISFGIPNTVIFQRNSMEKTACESDLKSFKVIFSCLISNFDGSAMKRHKFSWYLSGKLVVIVPKILELNLFLTLEVVWTVLSLFSQLMNQSLLHWMEHVGYTSHTRHTQEPTYHSYDYNCYDKGKHMYKNIYLYASSQRNQRST
jgi:hypothetical protein